MAEENIFEAATRLKLRYKIAQGVASTEDLWTLKLETLDELAKNLNKTLQDQGVSFIKKKTEANKETELAFAVVKHVIEIRLAEADERAKQLANAKRRKILTEALETKRGEALANMTEEQIMAELKSLEDKG